MQTSCFLCKLVACLLPVTAMLLSASSASAVVLLSWDLDGEVGSQATSTADFSDHLNGGAITRGPGLGASPASVDRANSFNANAWTTSASLDATDYYQVQFTIANDVSASLSSVDFNYRRTAAGPSSFQWGYGLNGSSITMIPNAFNFSSLTGFSSQDLSTVSGLQNITGGTLVSLRLFGYASGGGAGLFSFETAAAATNDVVVNGIVTPEPSTLTIFSVFGATTIVGAAWRRRRAKNATPLQPA
jgi:hypothetical protein